MSLVGSVASQHAASDVIRFGPMQSLIFSNKSCCNHHPEYCKNMLPGFERNIFMLAYILGTPALHFLHQKEWRMCRNTMRPVHSCTFCIVTDGFPREYRWRALHLQVCTIASHLPHSQNISVSFSRYWCPTQIF